MQAGGNKIPEIKERMLGCQPFCSSSFQEIKNEKKTNSLTSHQMAAYFRFIEQFTHLVRDMRYLGIEITELFKFITYAA